MINTDNNNTMYNNVFVIISIHDGEMGKSV